MQKSVFQILESIVKEDIKNNTRSISLSTNLIGVSKFKNSTKVQMRTDVSTYDILTDKKIPILILVDKDEYLKTQNQKT